MLFWFMFLQPGMLHFKALCQVGFGHLAREIAHFGKESLAFGHAHRTARIQYIECMGAFNNVIISRQH